MIDRGRKTGVWSLMFDLIMRVKVSNFLKKTCQSSLPITIGMEESGEGIEKDLPEFIEPGRVW